MRTRTKKRVVTAPLKNEVGDFMKQFAETSSQLKALEAEEELQLIAVRRQFEERSLSLLEQRQIAMEKLEAFGVNNREELFNKRKSMDLTHGIIGFRLGTPKVSKPRSLTWNKVIEILSEQESGFLRTKLEVDKDKIITSREDGVAMQSLKELGIDVVQEETFYISLKESEFLAQAVAFA